MWPSANSAGIMVPRLESPARGDIGPPLPPSPLPAGRGGVPEASEGFLPRRFHPRLSTALPFREHGTALDVRAGLVPPKGTRKGCPYISMERQQTLQAGHNPCSADLAFRSAAFPVAQCSLHAMGAETVTLGIGKTPGNKRTPGWGRARSSRRLPEPVELNPQPVSPANTRVSYFCTLLGKLHHEQGVRRTILGNCA
jgi:hypothetical protein